MKLINAEIKITCECGEEIIADWIDLNEKRAKKEVLIYFNKLKHQHENSARHKEFMLDKKNYNNEIQKYVE